MLSGPNVILTLKVAVAMVTVILVASLVSLALGRRRLHGRLNLAFFGLTMVAVFGLEVLIRFIEPSVFDYIQGDPDLARALKIHLCFSVPSALVMPVMLFTGLKHFGTAHRLVSVLFGALWIGTFVTGIFFLPH